MVKVRRLSIREQNDIFRANRGIVNQRDASAPISFQLVVSVSQDSNALQGFTWESPGTIGSSTPSTGAFTTLDIVSMLTDWTNAGRTIADLGIVTTMDVDGGTIDGVTIGGSVAGDGTFVNLTATSIIIGGNTLDTNEWANLDGQDQTVASTSSPTFVNLSITSMAQNWTNAGRTIADLGIVTTEKFGGATNYATFASDGEMSLHGTARVLKETRVTSETVRRGASAPAIAFRQIGTTATMLADTLQFSKTVQNDVYFIFHVEVDADFTVDGNFHLMWIPGAAWTSGNYVWKLEYIIKNELTGDSTTGASTIISADVTPSNAVDFIETRFATAIPLTFENVVFCHLYRDVASDNADDVGDMYELEMSYTSDKLGTAT